MASKRTWILRKSEDAVSPVIATILLVSIAVVLSAVLYVTVLQMMPSSQDTIIISLERGSTSTNWTFTVLQFMGTTSLPTPDVILSVRYPNMTVALLPTPLSEMNSSTYYNGIHFSDENPAGYLSAPDQISLDRSLYQVGTKIYLTNVAGTNTMAAYEIF